MRPQPIIGFAVCLLCCALSATAQTTRTLTGAVVNARNESVRGATVTVTVTTSTGDKTAVTDDAGNFSLPVPRENLIVRVSGQHIAANETAVSATEDNLRLEIEYVIPKIHDSLVISAAQLDPALDRRNEAVYRDTLFSRDDQVFHPLDAGINAGQHEGGGKSLEIRRFGFNLDHGGVNGGL